MYEPIRELFKRIKEHCWEKARHHTTPRQNIRASEAGECPRQIYLRLKGFRPKPRTPQQEMYGVFGDADHDIIRKLFIHYDIPIRGVTESADGTMTETIERQKVFEREGPSIPVVARADGEIDTYRGKCLLMEIKTIGHWKYDYLQKAYWHGGHDEALERVKTKHPGWYAQCQTAMVVLGYEMVYLVVKGRSEEDIGVYKLDENNKPIEETRTGIYVPLDMDHWATLLKKFGYIMDCMAQNEPPGLQQCPLPGSKECKWCDFHYMCYGAEQRKKAGKEPHIVYPGPQIDIHNQK
jgi:hypothetical protein